MSGSDKQELTEPPVKRRLSLRLGSDTGADKKFKYDHANQGQSGYRDRASTATTTDYSGDNEPPQTATSSRFAPQSTSSYSSPTSSNDGDEPDNRENNASRPETSNMPRRPSFQRPIWQTGDKERIPSTSSRSSAQARYHNTPSASAVGSTAASRHSSPPLSFNLSSGQPLVNPPPKTQAAFVGKLYSMLEDDDIAKSGLIYWSAEGATFTCSNPTEFSKQVLPRYFKHNNWQSFVRQLNMYSFNKVNDIYSTTTDPQSWEFRHSLFRKGEPHLLASIKRKSSRPSAQESGPMSPTEELSEMSRSVAGWMPDAGHATFRLPSPSRSSRVNPYSYGADVPPHPMKMEDDRPVSQSGVWESRQPGYRPALPPQPARIAVSSSSEPQTQHPLPRFHPDPSGPPLGPAQRYIPPGYPDSPHYPPATQLPHVEGVTGHLTYLEEKIQRLAEVINEDRVEHVRYNLDFSSYLLQMVGWVAGDAPSPEMRVLKDTLNRQNENMRQRYEAFVASDALAFMASGGAGSRDRDDRAVPPSLHHLSPFPAHQPRPFHSTTLPDLRPPSSSHGLPPRRSSPALGYGTSSVNLKARSLDEGGREGSSSFPPPFLMSSRDSKPLSQPSVPPPSPGAGIRDNRDGGDGYGFGHGHGREQTGEDRREVGSSGGYRSDPERKPVIREEGSSVEGESTSVKRGGLKSLLN